MGVIADIIFRRRNTDVYSRVDKERLPQHVAVIMDGNGRWAKKRALPRSAGHRITSYNVCYTKLLRDIHG